MPRTKSSEKSAKETELLRGDLHLPTVLHALSDEVRLDIVRQIAKSGPKACGTFGIKVPKSTLSHHFRVLRQAGVLTQQRDGQELVNSIRQEDLDARFPGLIAAVIA